MKQYLLNGKDVRKIKRMVRLLDKALAEIVQLKALRDPDEPFPHPPAQSDLIEESWFVEQQLSLIEHIPSRTDDF